MPELGLLLQNKPLLLQTSGMKRALVMTRAQVRENEGAEAEHLAKEERMGACPNPIGKSTPCGREADGVEAAVKKKIQH